MTAAHLVEPEIEAGALQQLIAYQDQLDADGIRVGVSRQALEEALDYISALLTYARARTAEVSAKDAEIVRLNENFNLVNGALGLMADKRNAAESLAQAERKRADDALEEAAKVCEKPKPECCGSFEQDEFSIDPVCCGKYEPGEFMHGIECASAIRALKTKGAT